MKIIILAAGIGSRLGNPYPKPLTVLKNGKKIMQHQIENISEYFSQDQVCIVVGFKKDLIMEEFPDMLCIYNENFDNTNTSKSLLKALKKFNNEDVLWLNGDVVFDKNIIEEMMPFINESKSFVCVNTSKVGDEEVKYTVDKDGSIKNISKSVKNGLGEAVGINFISKKDINDFILYLEKCEDQDYFEKGIEMLISEKKTKIFPLDISKYFCMEIDFKEDLNKANSLL